jgi:UPF0716 protein FxsA
MKALERESTRLRDSGRRQGSAGGAGGRGLFMRLIEGDLLFKLIGVLLLYALVPLGEIFLFVYLGSLMGNFLVLALALAAGIAGAVVAIQQAHRELQDLKSRVAAGKDPTGNVVELAGIFVAAVLLVTPGFITDICGYVLFFPRVRRWAGQGIAKLLASRLGSTGRVPLYSLKIR